ncbi:MAG: anti-sigma factor [Acidobacteriia bacterium]|nr:anti-sigma factor [Terriglobia bacterium]
MNCEEARALLTAYVDGELDLIHSLEIEKHIEACEACRRSVENQRTLRFAIERSSLRYEPTAAIEGRIETALRSSAPPNTRTQRGRWPWIAIAAGVLLATFIVGRWPFGVQPAVDNMVAQEILDSHLRSLLPGHLTDVQSSDRHTVKPWFSGRTDFSPPVEDFAAQGFRLIGGRLDSVSGRTVAALVYQHRQHSINLYVWPLPGAPDASATSTARQGYNLIHWTQAGLSYWLASDLNAEELQSLATLLRRALANASAP